MKLVSGVPYLLEQKMKKDMSASLGRVILKSYTTLCLDLLKFVERLKATIGKNFVAERP